MSLLEPRPTPSQRMRLLSPLLACVLTLCGGAILFRLLGHNPLVAFRVFFIDPLNNANGLSEWLLKASPLILIAQGLAIGFRARVYNIGAEGQLIAGATLAGGMALWLDGSANPLVAHLTLPLMIVAGAVGGGLWGGLAALLKTRYRADETLTTLMLTYIASLGLAWLVNGPWRDPNGMNFPQTILFSDKALFPLLFEGLRLNASLFITVLACLGFWFFNARSFLSYTLTVAGQAPHAARYAGFSGSRTIWFSLVVSGMCAGLAGVGEVAGPVGQLNLNLSPGYGFAAIIVAYLGRLNPLGIVGAGLLMALIYLGGEAAQVTLQLPSAITGLFQGMLLFFLLGADVLVDFRLRRLRRRTA